ncbi:MAG: 50S ribosomal protein L30 [Sulfolobus sp.]|nr:50S ribosomal protein L30 [Sulfolobus sp.]
MTMLAIVRIRGYAGAPWYINDTLKMLRLSKKFNAMVYPKTDSIEGMLRKAEPYITWGELNLEGAIALVKRLRIKGGTSLDSIPELKEKGITNEQELAKAIIEGTVLIHKMDNVFSLPIRLHPPSGGFKGKINRPYKLKGEFGYRGDKINELLVRMS